MKMNSKNKNGGFTIIESVVVMCIIGILAATAALGYGEITRQKNLEKASQRVASSLSQARDYSVFGKEINGKFPCGYGIMVKTGSKKITFVYTNQTSDGTPLDRTSVMGLTDNVTCDDLIGSKTITLLEYPEDTTWFTAASDVTNQNEEHVSVTDIKKIEKDSNISVDCLILLFSAPRGGSYFCSTDCSGDYPPSCQFNVFSGSNPFTATLSIKDGVVTRDKTINIYSSGNVTQQ